MVGAGGFEPPKSLGPKPSAPNQTRPYSELSTHKFLLMTKGIFIIKADPKAVVI